MNRKRNPRILIVTPEITYLPEGMGNFANKLSAKAGGLADVSASLVTALFELGADVHVALPHYRRIFQIEVGNLISDELRIYKRKLPTSRIHLAEDRAFYYQNAVYSGYDSDHPTLALAFQREVINNIIPLVKPDLIHCNDWMTGLIPAMARREGMHCLFTLHNVHTWKMTLTNIENHGIDAAEFWRYLYYDRVPHNYEETRPGNKVDLLASGVFAAHFINTVSPTFLEEIVDGHHPFVPDNVRREIAGKVEAGCAVGILNAPDMTYDPQGDKSIVRNFGPSDHADAKRENKVKLQESLGLNVNPSAPILFWPHRLDPVQKGPQLFAHILYDLISAYWDLELQIVIVANGPFQEAFRAIVAHHDFNRRVAVCNFDEALSHQGFAGSDFMIMPSLFEPCGLPQMIGCLYGSLPVVHDTGGLHDTVTHLNLASQTGNGFVFETYDASGLRWAIDQALAFYQLPAEKKEPVIERIMRQGSEQFNHGVTAAKYVDIYEKMLDHPLVQGQ